MIALLTLFVFGFLAFKVFFCDASLSVRTHAIRTAGSGPPGQVNGNRRAVNAVQWMPRLFIRRLMDGLIDGNAYTSV